MIRRTHAQPKKGTVLALVAVSMVALCGFMALAIDLGLYTVAQAQCQNAADAAALAGARSLDGSTPDLPLATSRALAAAQANSILESQILPAEVSIQHGSYHYDSIAEVFQPQFPPTPPDSYNLTRVTITKTCQTAFAQVLGVNFFQVQATAVAAHRPRDVTIVLDYSGSMNNESDLWNNEGYLGSANDSPNNTDSVFPRFGPYSDISNARLQCTSSDSRVGKCNITKSALGIPPLVNDFYSHTRGSANIPAFSSVSFEPTTYYGTQNTGERFLTTARNTSTTPAKTTSEILNNQTSRDWTFELDGYARFPEGSSSRVEGRPDYSYAQFLGHTQGPGYWGKTFAIWPPDPRAGPFSSSTTDRSTVLQFLKDFDDNDSSITWSRDSYGNFTDSQVLAIVNNWPWSSQDSLDTHLRTKVRRYSSGPFLDSSIPSYHRILRLHNRPFADWRGLYFLNYSGSYPNFGGPLSDNTKLWDSSGNLRSPPGYYVINYKAILAWIKKTPCPFPPQLRAGRILYYTQIPDDVPASAYNHSLPNSQISNQDQRFWKEYIDYVLGVWRDPFGNIKTPGSPACSYGPDWNWGTIRISAKPTDGRYMDYRDNPKRFRHRFWFGPMTLVQFLMDTGHLPGTAHDISMYPAKLGIAGALLDIKNNHPNDLVSLIMFCRPQFDNDPAGVGTFSQAVFSLSRDYQGMIDALWFPPNSSSSDVRPWDPDGRLAPRAFGDFTSNTATHHGFLLAYNQFNSSSSLRSQLVGGYGRRGTQRLVILETDGMANVNTKMGKPFVLGAPGRSYYQIQPGDPISSSSYNETELLDVVRRLCADENDQTLGPGFSTSRRPVLIHTIGFGAVFEPNASGSDRSNAVALLQKISTIGKTRFPSDPSDPADGYKWCIGTIGQRKDKLRQAFGRIMDDGVSVTLVE